MNYIEEEGRDIKNIFNRFKKKDFSGDSGQVLKNSTYSLTTSIIAKIGSVFFTIIIARMLGVELYGLYTLALSTILLFAVFSDLGLSTAMITYVSKSLGKKEERKAKTYFKGILKYKIRLALISSFLLMTIGYLVVNYYYTNKPIYLALLIGAIYIPITNISDFIKVAFQAGNNFQAGTIREIIFQVLRFIIIPILILLSIKLETKDPMSLALIFLGLTACHFIGLVYLRIIAKKKIPFLRKKAKPLTKEEKLDLKKFILPLTFTALSGTFFGFIDSLMLGHYVDATHIGYYGSAFALIGSAGAILGFISTGVLPVLSRTKGKSLEKIFRKARSATILIGIPATIFTAFFAKYILLIYGSSYIPATQILQLFSIILLIMPIAALYNAYFTSIKKTAIIAKLLIASTIVNIVLNFIFINYGLQFSMMHAVIGACIATICSRIFYLAGLAISKKLDEMG